MPAPLNVNREAVKTLALAIGVRQAAREMGLPEKTVLGWSHRFNWFNDKRSETAVINGVRAVKSPEVKAPSVAMSDALARLGESSRVHLAKAGAKASKHLAGQPGAKIVRASADLKNVVQANATLHGWDQKSAGGPAVMVNVALLGVNPSEVNVSGESS